MKLYKNILAILFAFLFIGNIYGQELKVSAENDLKEDMALVPCKYKDRLDTVKKLFLKMGASEDRISTEKFKEGTNLVVKLKGSSDETIVIGAHYDKTDEGCGAIDNWTGIVIIANLYKTLSQYKTTKSYAFVAFDNEEKGLFGSAAMVKAIPKENYAQYCSMVNLDSFGFTAIQAPSNMTSPKMMQLAKDLAKEGNIPFNDRPIPGADADSSSFISKKIPAITFDGLPDNWQDFLHSKNDKIENVNMKSVYFGYRFSLLYITRLDAASCGNFR